MNKNQEYIEHLKVEEVPWHRITTTYGRATDFPQYFKIMWDMENITHLRHNREEIDTEHNLIPPGFQRVAD